MEESNDLKPISASVIANFLAYTIRNCFMSIFCLIIQCDEKSSSELVHQNEIYK